MSQRDLRLTLERYAETCPERATYTGDTFVIKASPLSTITKLAIGVAAVFFAFFTMLALTIVWFIVSATRGMEGGLGWTVGGTSAIVGLGVVSLPIIAILLVVDKQRMSVTIDITNGDVTARGLFGARSLPNLASVQNYRMQVVWRGSAGAGDGGSGSGSGSGNRMLRSCQLNSMVNGRLRSEPIAYFRSDSAMYEFEPVANALVQHFSASAVSAG